MDKTKYFCGVCGAKVSNKGEQTRYCHDEYGPVTIEYLWKCPNVSKGISKKLL
jgi:hypothetical protein